MSPDIVKDEIDVAGDHLTVHADLGPASLDVMDNLVRASFAVVALLSQAAAAQSSVSGLINRAVGRGIVQRKTSGDDGRAVRVSLTSAGRRLALAMTDEIACLIAPRTNRLSSADQQRIGVLLNRMLE